MSQTRDELAKRLESVRAIAIDGGTTNTRARLVEGGRVVATARREVGVRDSALSTVGPPPAANAMTQRLVESKAQRLTDAVRTVIEEVARQTTGSPPDLIVAAGMLSSELGLLAVPHRIAPAGIVELAAAMEIRTIPEVAPIPIGFIPGVRTPAVAGIDGWTRADVMRGEECETLGALLELTAAGEVDPREGGLVFVWPGSHTKVVEVDEQGRIARSQTSLAGELLQAVARHTLLSASLPAELPEVLDQPAVSAGSRTVVEQGLNRAAFLVRVAAIEGALSASERAAFWIGAVVTDDSLALSRHPILSRSRWVGVGGREPLRSLYVQALGGRIPAPVVRMNDELCERASALGALSVALSRAQGRESGSLNPR